MLTDNSKASESGVGFFFYHLGKILFQNEREVYHMNKKKKNNLFISALEHTTQTVVICVLTWLKISLLKG